MSFPKYPKYKDSGVEWLGEVPEGWRTTLLKHLTSKIGSGVTPRGGGEVYVPEGVIFLRSQNVYDEGLRLDDVVYIDSETNHEMRRTQIQGGDILINLTGASLGRTCLVPTRFATANVSQHVCIVRLSTESLNKFVAFSLKSPNTKLQIEATQTGSGREGLNFEQLGNTHIVVPNDSQESDAIAAFLDHETAKIDALIEEQRRLIELLKEKRQAVISHAVTKGRDKTALIKNSGIEWVGDIPAHWTTQSLRRTFQSVEYGISESLDAEAGVAILRMGNIQNGKIVIDDLKFVEAVDPQLLLRVNDLLYNRTNSLELIGKVGLVKDLGDAPMSFASYLVRLRLKQEHSPAFFSYLLNTEGLLGYARTNAFVAIGQCNLNPTRYGEIGVALPAFAEQVEIVRFLDEETSEMERLEQQSSAVVDILQERRSALISAAVTGKIDVRQSARKPVAAAKSYNSGFAHQLIAATILARCNDKHMGRTKLQKLIHVTEYHAQIEELRGEYTRKMAGPLDMRAMVGLERGLEKQRWYKTVREEKRYRYQALEKSGQHDRYLERWSEKLSRIDEVITLMGSMTMRQCEIVSTLYAAWNDLLIEGLPASDDAILKQAATAEGWHESKERTPLEKWDVALQWMKKKGIIPTGFGTHTHKAVTGKSHEPA